MTSDTGHRYLYILIQVTSLEAGLKIVNNTVGMAMKSKLSESSHFSLDNAAITISLNTPAKIDLNDSHFALAQQINNAAG